MDRRRAPRAGGGVVRSDPGRRPGRRTGGHGVARRGGGRRPGRGGPRGGDAGAPGGAGGPHCRAGRTATRSPGPVADPGGRPPAARHRSAVGPDRLDDSVPARWLRACRQLLPRRRGASAGRPVRRVGPVVGTGRGPAGTGCRDPLRAHDGRAPRMDPGRRGGCGAGGRADPDGRLAGELRGGHGHPAGPAARPGGDGRGTARARQRAHRRRRWSDARWLGWTA